MNNIIATKKCKRCKEILPIEEFALYGKMGRRRQECQRCMNEETLRRAEALGGNESFNSDELKGELRAVQQQQMLGLNAQVEVRDLLIRIHSANEERIQEITSELTGVSAKVNELTVVNTLLSNVITEMSEKIDRNVETLEGMQTDIYVIRGLVDELRGTPTDEKMKNNINSTYDKVVIMASNIDEIKKRLEKPMTITSPSGSKQSSQANSKEQSPAGTPKVASPNRASIKTSKR